MCDNSVQALRRCAVVELEHPGEALTAPNRAGVNQGSRGRDAFIAQTLVRPFLMIVIDKRSYGSPEVSFAEWHNARQTLGLDGPDKSFGKRVQIRTPGRQQQGRHTTVPKSLPEGDGVERVSVSNSSSGRCWELDKVTAVGDPTHIGQLGTSDGVSASEAHGSMAVQ